MAPQTSQLELAWSSLSVSEQTGDGWRSISVSPPGSATVLAGCRFPDGAQAILIRFSNASLPATMRLPEGSGFLVERTSFEGKVSWISLTRRLSASESLFTSMAEDVVRSLAPCPAENESMALAILLGRVRAWQEFMRKGGDPLSAEAETGLFGELLVLQRVLDEGVDAAVACEAWLGPLDGLRDFELGTGGIEVKSTLSSLGFRARVASLDQLDDTDRQPLFVAALRLRQTAAGRTLPDLVANTRDVIAGDAVAERLLAERLIASGYRDEHIANYSRRFELQEMRVFRVGEGFPRLTPHTVPAGIKWASYEIDLDITTADDLDIRGALAELEGI